MKRGEVHWYTFGVPDKRRPVLILTRSAIIPYLNTVTVAPITTTIRDIPSEVLLTQEDGMRKTCAANMDNIQTISQRNIGKTITRLSLARLDEVSAAVSFALGLNDVF